jgi:hypothetical protein
MRTALALLIVLFSNVAMADPRKDTEKFASTLAAQSDLLDRHSGNVLQMLDGNISDDDYKHANSGYDEASKFAIKLGQVEVLANLYVVMINKFDLSVAKKLFLIECESTLKVGLATTEKINHHMAGVRSQALLEEMKAMRDDSQTLVDTLNFCKK